MNAPVLASAEQAAAQARRRRATLALIGLSVPILGVMGLFSVSNGLRNMVGDTLSQVEGLMVDDTVRFALVGFNVLWIAAWLGLAGHRQTQRSVDGRS